MSSRLLYQDHTAALTADALVLRGFTKILGRPRRIPITDIATFKLRDRTEFPNDLLPPWGVNDDGVWYTRDRRRYRRQASIELTFSNDHSVGFSPAHPTRFRELLLNLGVKER